MADESEENSEKEEVVAEDVPVESEVVESQPVEPVESQPVAEAQVVEAQVVAPNVRKPLPRWVFAAGAALAGLLVVVGVVMAVDSWVISSESDAFGGAHQRGTFDAWSGYLTWAEDQGAWTRARTPMERHIAEATERRDERRARGAAETSDWTALCTMLGEFDGAAPAYATAQAALRERVATIVMRAQTQMNSASLPEPLMQPIYAAMAELQTSPCGLPARVRFQIRAASTVVERETLLAAASSAIDVGLQPVVQELTARTELFAFELSDSDAGDPVPLEYSVNAEFDAGDTVRLSDGSNFVIPALSIEVRVHGPSTQMASDTIRYTLPAAFGVEIFAESRSGKSAEELTTLAVDRLAGHVASRLRQVAGLTVFRPDGGVAAFSRCATMEVIAGRAFLQSNTRDRGSDHVQFSCEDPQEPYYEGCCEGEDLNAVGRPEIGYRLMVNERSLVSLSVEADFSPLVSIKDECETASQEFSCGNVGHTRAVLEPGVYTAYVAGTGDEEAGMYTLAASIQPMSAIPQACAALTLELQSGVAVTGSTTRAEDNFSSECGGAAVGEDTYRLAIAERSRVRCHVDGFDGIVLHARSDCADFESEVSCGVTDMRFVAEPGTLFVSVDGIDARAKGAYELKCEVQPVPPAVDGDLCAAAEVLEVTAGETPVPVDLLSASEPRAGLCGNVRGPESVYRFELSEDSFVQASAASPILVGVFDECSRGTCEESVGVRLSAGTHYLVARGRTNLDFTSQSMRLRTTPIAPICEAAVLLRAGATGGAVSGPREPVIFDAECATATTRHGTIFRVRALSAMHLRVRADGFGLSVHEGCGGRSLTCGSGSIEARLDPGEYTLLVRGPPASVFQLETEIERL